MPWIAPGFWRIADLTLDAGFTGKTLDDVTRDVGALPTLRILERRPSRQPADRRLRSGRHAARHPVQRVEDLPVAISRET